MRIRTVMQCGVVVLLAVIQTAGAGVLIWDGARWPQPTLTPRTYTVDGVDITLTFSGNTSRMLGADPYYLPKDNIPSAWGIQGLWYGVSQLPGAESIGLTIEFSKQVKDVRFNYYDVDGKDSYERIAVKGSLSAATLYPTITAPAGSMNIYPAVGAIQSNGTFDGDPGLAGNTANFFFQNQTLNKATITYTTNRMTTGVLLGNISFTLPEPATMAILGMGALMCRKFKKA